MTIVFAIYMVYTVVSLWWQRLAYLAIPSPPVDDFWNGHGITMKAAKKNNTFMDMFGRWTKTHGKSIMVFARFRPILFTVDPVMIKAVTGDLKLFSKLDDLPNRSLYGQRIAGWNSILTGGGHNWGIKRKVMSKFFAKANMEAVFQRCKPLITNYVRTTLEKKVGSGKVLELHDELSYIFCAYPSAVGLEGFDSPEIIGRKITTILEMIPKQIGDAFSISKILFGASQQKTETVAMVSDTRQSLKTLVLEKSNDMAHLTDEEIPSTDVFGQMIKANEACDFGKESLDEFVVDDILTIYLVMDNMVKQVRYRFIIIAYWAVWISVHGKKHDKNK